MILMTGSTVFGPEGAKFTVLDYLGSGSFGTVYKVEGEGGELTLAMKTVPTPFTDAAALKAFVNEGNLAVGIRHPNVIEYLFFHDGTTHPGLPPYILMEYADGGTLHDQLITNQQKNKRFSNDELLGMCRQLAAGMAAINERLIHRDIKPDNILISGGVLKISDFGLSKIVVEATRKSTFKGFGCVAYMAPEAWRFEKNTVQLDIYAMGIVFYQLATLRHPFDLKTPDQRKWMEAHIYQPVQRPDKFNPDLPPQISQVIMKMLEKDSSRRFADWGSIDNLLDAGIQSEEGSKTLVSAMLMRRLEQDTAIQAAQAEQSRKTNEWSQFRKLVLSQGESTLIPPIKGLVREFNAHYAGAKAVISEWASSESMMKREVRFPSAKSVFIHFAVVREEEFMRRLPIEEYGRIYERNVNQCPKFRDRRVQGWGVIKGSDGRGFNVLLVERPGEIYGEFMVMFNKVGPFAVSIKPIAEPFAFEFDDLEGV